MDALADCLVNAIRSEPDAVAHDLLRHNLLRQNLLRRDPEALNHLIEQYHSRLLRYLNCLAGNRELAADLAQETWIRVLERGHQYNGKHEFCTWLYAIARNLTVDYLRKRTLVSLDGLSGDEHQAPLEPVDTQPAAWELVAQHEQAALMDGAMASLPAEYREAVTLRFQEQMSLEEVAAVTGVPLGTVKSRLYRGLGLLTTKLKGAGR